MGGKYEKILFPTSKIKSEGDLRKEDKVSLRIFEEGKRRK